MKGRGRYKGNIKINIMNIRCKKKKENMQKQFQCLKNKMVKQLCRKRERFNVDKRNRRGQMWIGKKKSQEIKFEELRRVK